MSFFSVTSINTEHDRTAISIALEW